MARTHATTGSTDTCKLSLWPLDVSNREFSEYFERQQLSSRTNGVLPKRESSRSSNQSLHHRSDSATIILMVTARSKSLKANPTSLVINNLAYCSSMANALQIT